MDAQDEADFDEAEGELQTIKADAGVLATVHALAVQVAPLLEEALPEGVTLLVALAPGGALVAKVIQIGGVLLLAALRKLVGS